MAIVTRLLIYNGDKEWLIKTLKHRAVKGKIGAGILGGNGRWIEEKFIVQDEELLTAVIDDMLEESTNEQVNS